MPDNATIKDANNVNFAVVLDEVPYSGDTAKLQRVSLLHATGAEGAKTVHEIAGNGPPAVSAYGLTVRPPQVSTFRRVTTADANPVNIKASAASLRGVHAFNKSDVPFYIKFHDNAGAPTAGAGVVFAVAVQAGRERDLVLAGGGKNFPAGLAMTVVRDLADAGATAVAAEDGLIEVSYE